MEGCQTRYAALNFGKGLTAQSILSRDEYTTVFVVVGVGTFVLAGAAYFLYFTLNSLFSYSSEYGLDLVSGACFAVVIAALMVAFVSMVIQGNVRGLYSRSGKIFWLLLAITIVTIPFIPSSTALRPNCSGPVPYGPHALYNGVDYVTPITVYTLNSISYSSFQVGMTYNAYFTVANIVTNAWPVDGYRFMLLNNTIVNTYVAPIDYCP